MVLIKDIFTFLLNPQAIFFHSQKDDLQKECPDILKLGLLYADIEGTTPSYASFAPKAFQQFQASEYVTRSLETSQNIQVICDIFDGYLREKNKITLSNWKKNQNVDKELE